jgi:hypothetical protein
LLPQHNISKIFALHPHSFVRSFPNASALFCLLLMKIKMAFFVTIGTVILSLSIHVRAQSSLQPSANCTGDMCLKL